MEEKRHTTSAKYPDQKELEKELSEYLSRKYGGKVKIISPFFIPRKKEYDLDEGRAGEKGKSILSFDLMPEELEVYLDNYIVKQDQAKAVLATKICTHFNRVKYLKRQGKDKDASTVGMIKNNILMIGPTGVGKTYIVKLIANRLGVPFVKGDATKFSETGYVGGDVEDLVRDLVYTANDDIELAEHGIIYIDEIDKIASSKNIIGHDVSRSGVQRALLKPMEETEVDLKVPHDAVSQIQAIEHYRKTGKRERRVVNTKNILFIMSGAFNDLAEIIKKRLQKQGIGFEADVRPTKESWDILKHVTAQDLIEFGFETEFVGRLPVIVVFDELTKDDLFEILKNPNNPIILTKKRDFLSYGISLRFENEALEKIADMAYQENTGARGLVSAIEKVLILFEKHLPSTDIKELLVTSELVDDPEGELERLKSDHESLERKERFERCQFQEIENIKEFIMKRKKEFKRNTELAIYERRAEVVAKIALKEIYDLNTAFNRFRSLYDSIRIQEETLFEGMDINITFDETAIDEIIARSVETDEDVNSIAYELSNKLEYGLRLVKDRTGISQFVIDGRALTEMENYISELVRSYYKS